MRKISYVAALFSLLLIFVPNVKASENGNNEDASILLSESTDLESFSEVNIDVVNSQVEIVDGDHHGIEIYVSHEDLILEDLFNIEVANNALTLDEKDWKNNLNSLFNNFKSKIVITTPEMADLSANIEFVNGELRIQQSIKRLYADIVNGDILLAGHKSYPIELKFVNADVEMFFDEYDANFVLEFVNGNIEILDDKLSARLSDFRRTVGDGTHDIRIDAVNGTVVIEGRAR